MAGKREQQMKEITERLEQGVRELFTSEMYTEYLKTMSQFHNYSFNNTLLIAMQKPDATLVAGYQAWQKKFRRQVKKGEKGIQIIAPAPIREKEEVEKFDPVTNEPILRPDGQPETEEVVHTIPRFRVATVFDVSQTYGEPLPELETPELMGSVENFEIFMQAIREVSPVPIRFDEIESGAKGYYSNANKETVIQDGMSESQTMKTAVHETTHAKLHDRDIMEELGEKKNQMAREVEAESVAYTVCQYFGLDTSDYSFPYIAGWSSSVDMKELRASMDTIRKTAGEFIDSMTEVMQRLLREQPQKEHLKENDLIWKVVFPDTDMFTYHVVENMDKEELLVQLRSYHDLYSQSDEMTVETFLEGQGARLIPWYDSASLMAEYPVNFYDVEYAYGSGITDISELSAMNQAEFLMNRAEYGKTLFNDDDRNLIINYASKFDNLEDTKQLIRGLLDTMEAPDLRTAGEIRRNAQAEIDALPDSMMGLSEMHRYGYLNDAMLPVGQGRAHELFREGFGIFTLYPDNTEAELDDEGEIDTHDGLYGIEKEVWEKYYVTEVLKEELPDAEKQYQAVELFDVPALFANGRVDMALLPPGMYRYELRGADYDPGYPLTVENYVAANHAATILTAVPLDLPEQGYLRLGSELNFTGGMRTAAEYQKEMAKRSLAAEKEKMENAIGRANEPVYLSGQDECYAIYQIARSTKGREYQFMSMDFVASHDMTVDAEDYMFVYGGRLSGEETLESLYEKFNINHPVGYGGHSLSVSDVVVLQKDGHAKAYYVDSLGFAELPDFVRQRLHEAEMNRKREDSAVTLDTSGIEIEQHEGLWHTADKREIADEIFYLMKHNEYGDSVASVIVNADGKLVAQELENGFDRGAMEAIREYLAEKGSLWEQELEKETEIPEKKSYPPVYRNTLAYAMEHGAADEYLDSRKLNIDCKKAVEDAIRSHFDGMHLAHDVADAVLEEYGGERLFYVLACTVQYKESDGRFSRDTKAWAASVPVPENISRGIDLNHDYVVESHPAVLDGFIEIARDKFAELEKMQEKEKPEPFIARYYVVNDAYGVKAEREYQYFENMETALSAYSELPNHLDKQLGMESTEQPPSRMPLINCRNGIEDMEDIEFDSLSGKWINDEVTHAYNKAQFYLDNKDSDIVYELPAQKGYFYIQTTAEGFYDYTFYDRDYQELDGGVYENEDISVQEAVEELLAEEGIRLESCHAVSWYEFMGKVAEVVHADARKKAAEFTKEVPVLTGEQADVLDKIARASGMDCWFSIGEDNSYIFDFENNEKRSLKEGIQTLQEGMTSYQDYEMSAEEISVFEDLLIKLGIEPVSEKLPPISNMTEPEKSLGGLCRAEIEETVLCYAQAQIDEMGLADEVKLLGARVYGSRTREGLYHDSSDVDVVLSYTGNIREDDFFNILHEDGMRMAGLPLDMNPISTEKTGTLEEYMENAEQYLDRKKAQMLTGDIVEFEMKYETDLDMLAFWAGEAEMETEPIYQVYEIIGNAIERKDTGKFTEHLRQVIETHGAEEPIVKDAAELLGRLTGEIAAVLPDPKISFYVAECMEFPVLGAYYDNLTLQEAVQKYEEIPADRINGIKGIGFRLEDGSTYDGDYGLMSGGEILRDSIDLVPHYKESPLVQKAIADLEEILSQNQQQEIRSEVPQKVPMQKEPEADNTVTEGTGRKQSVLKALRERQAKRKEQEQKNTGQKAQNYKKGDQEL